MMDQTSRIPPHAVDVEREILGALLTDKEALPKALEILDASCFYNPTNQRYYNAIVSLFEQSIQVDAITLTDELKKRGTFNPSEDPLYISHLTSTISTSANIEFHCRIVYEKAMRRQLISTSFEYGTRAYNETDDTFDLLDEAEGALFKITEKRTKKSAIPIKIALSKTLEHLQSIHGKNQGITGVPSGFSVIDDPTGGFQNGDLIIVAGRPSQGKTAFALSVARNSAMNKERQIPVAFFSIEMSEQQLMNRLVASEARIDAHKLRTGRLTDDDWTKMSRSVSPMAQAKMFIDDTPAIGILELRAKARRLKAEHDIGLMIVDYLQLIQGPKNSESREREISNISRSLKALAKEVNIPVIALSQLNRSVEGRVDKRPLLSDLRESGAIEQDADVVLFVHRPETYGILEIKDENEGTISSSGIAEIIIGKQRNGPTGICLLSFIKMYSGFEPLASRAFNFMASQLPPQSINSVNSEVPF